MPEILASSSTANGLVLPEVLAGSDTSCVPVRNAPIPRLQSDLYCVPIRRRAEGAAIGMRPRGDPASRDIRFVTTELSAEKCQNLGLERTVADGTVVITIGNRKTARSRN